MIETRSILDGDPLADIADQLVPALDDLDDFDDDPLEALDWEGPDWFDPADFELSFPDPTAQSPTAPDSAVPGSAHPDRAASDRAVPDRAVPDSAVPDRAAPDSAVPDRVAPEMSLADLGPDQLLDELQVAHRRIAASQARQALLITELAHRRAQHAVTELTGRKARGMEALTIGARAVGEEVALELSLSKTAGQNLTDTCVGLCLEAPETLDSLAAGEIDWAKAAEILLLVQKLRLTQADTNPDLPEEERVDPEELGRELEKRLLDRASEQTLAALKRRGRKDMIEANPRAAENRARRERTRRFFAFLPDDDSMARLSAYLPADAGMRAKNALTRLAYHARNQSECGDRRTLDQLRVDALVDTLVQAADDLHTDDEGGPAGAVGTRPAAPRMPKSDTQEQNSGTARSPKPASPGSGPIDSEPSGPAATEPERSRPAATQPSEEGPTEPVDHPAASFAVPTGDGYYPDTDLNDLAPNADETICDDKTPDDDALAHDEAFPDDLSANECLSGSDMSTRLGSSPTRSTPSRYSRSDPRVQITIGAGTLIGLDDDPGWLHGYGPIIASMARDIAATGTWRCAVTDPDHGTLMGLGTGTYTRGYRPTQALRRHLQARDRVCRVPGCNVAAEQCDVDHRVPWRRGGSTCECCTECLCETHHRMKHEYGFTLTLSTNPSDPPGTLIWTTPSGREHPSYPAQLGKPCRKRNPPGPSSDPDPGPDPAPGPAPGPALGPDLGPDPGPDPDPALGPDPGPDPALGPAPGPDPGPDRSPSVDVEQSPDRGQDPVSGLGGNESALRDGELPKNAGAHTGATDGAAATECHACSEADRVNTAEEELWARVDPPSRRAGSSAESRPDTSRPSPSPAGSTSGSGSASDRSTSDTPSVERSTSVAPTECPVEAAAADGSAEPWRSRLRMLFPLVISPLPQDGDPPPF